MKKFDIAAEVVQTAFVSTQDHEEKGSWREKRSKEGRSQHGWELGLHNPSQPGAHSEDAIRQPSIKEFCSTCLGCHLETSS